MTRSEAYQALDRFINASMALVKARDEYDEAKVVLSNILHGAFPIARKE